MTSLPRCPSGAERGEQAWPQPGSAQCDILALPVADLRGSGSHPGGNIAGLPGCNPTQGDPRRPRPRSGLDAAADRPTRLAGL
jgi:hypothetical protein